MRCALVAVALFLAPLTVLAQGDEARLVWDHALDQDATAHLVIRDADGAQVLVLQNAVDRDAREETITLPPLPRAAATLQAGLSAGGRVVMQSQMRSISNRSANGLELHLEEQLALGFQDRWVCEDGITVRTTRKPEGIALHIGGVTKLFQDDPAQAGQFRTDDGQEWRQGADLATLTRPDLGAIDCTPSLFRPILPLEARGHADIWRVSIDPDQTRIELPDREAETVATADLISLAPRDGTISFESSLLRLQLKDARCRLDQIDMPFPFSAQLAHDAEGSWPTGCAGSPLRLIDKGRWAVTSIFGQILGPVGEAAAPEMTLQIIGQEVAGRGTCNRYVGTIGIDGDQLRISDLGTTRLACPLNKQHLELRFLDALEVATGFDLSRDNMLVLRAGPIPVLTAHRR